MKLLKLVSNLQAAKDIETTLKSVGILTLIANIEPESSDASKPKIGMVKVGVWVVLDYQYEEALQVLDNPQYIVKQPLIPQDIAAMSKEMYTPYSRKARQLIYFIALIFLGVLALCVFSYLVST